MAVLTRPLFHAQERIDLEDFNQLLSGLRTDSKLYTRQILGDRNYILSGFNASGLNTPQLTIDILGASMLFSGKESPVGTSNITIIDNALLPANSATADLLSITFTKDDGSTIVFSQGATENFAGGIWSRGVDATATAISIRNAIVGLASDEFPVASNPTPTTGVVNLTSSSDDIGQGFINIEVSPSGAGFQRLSDTVINSFDYTGDIVESPSDLSWWTIHSDATAAESRLTQEITSQFRAPTGVAVRTLIVYAKLVTEEATPITKAFWDPSANSGSGAEFNQRVNTAVDLAVQLNFQDSPLTGSELFANTEVCRLEVDGSGNILAIRDTRELYFEGVDTYDWNRTAPFATITTLTTIPANVTTPTISINSIEFQVNERVNFFTLTDANVNVPPAATSKISSATDGATPTLGLEKFDLSAISTYGFLVVGSNSGAVRLVETINSNFVRDDKELSSFKEWIDAVTTGIRQAKGTDNWFDDVDGNVQDALSFINSTTIAHDDLAVYRWEPTSTGGTLNIETNPAALADFTFDGTTQLASGDTITIGTTTFTAGTDFAIGATTTITASNFDTVANANANFTATRDGLVVTVSTTDRANFLNGSSVYTVAISQTNAGAVTVTRELGESASGDLVAIRVFNRSAQLFLERQAIEVPADHILYVTFPLDEDFADNGNGIGLRYDGVVDFNTERAKATYNSLDPIFGEAFNPNFLNTDSILGPGNGTSTPFIGRLKTIPFGEFVNDGRNYWIAACELTTGNDPSILHIRGVGAVNGNESIPIGEGVTNNTITYIGASGPNDSTPNYPSITSIDAHGTSNQSAYTTTSNFNTNVISQSEDLTRAISDINDHLVSLKDVNYQDKGLKLIGGGFWSWDVSGTNANTLQITDNAFIQIPGLPNASNSITSTVFNALGTLADGQVIQVVVNRTTTAGTATLSIVDIAAVTPGMNTFILARRVGINVQLGIPAAMRLAPGEVSPIDGALAFFGLTGRNGELPRQLRTSIEGNQQIDIESADAIFRIGGFTDSSTPADDTVTLTIPVGTGILQWEGGSFTVTTAPIGVAGELTVNSIFHPGVNNNFRERTSATTFSIPSLADGESVWMGLAIDAADSGIATGDTDLTYLTAYANANPNLPTFFGRRKGEPGVSFGNVTGTAAELAFAEFDGDVPVAQVLLTRTGSALNVLSNSDVVVLGASGGGGGGGGTADQDLNNYLNRLNLSTFGYLTPVIAAQSTTLNLDSTALTTAGLSTSGFSIIPNAALTTTTLLDPDFTDQGLIPDRLEIEATWSADPSDSTKSLIDPNAVWSISFNSNDTSAQFSPLTSISIKNVAGYITGLGALIGTNLTNAALTQINTVFIENHNYSTGHKITLSGIGLSLSAPASTPPISSVRYVRVIDQDSFFLFDSAEEANNLGATAGRATLSGTDTGTSAFTIAAGIISRIGVTDVVRAVFDTRVNSVIGTPYSSSGVINANALVRLRVVGDTNAADRGATFEALLSSLALFYADELGVEGVNPNGLDDVNDILRSSHLVNADNANASYGVAGRGVTLLNSAGTNTEIALDTNNNITIDGTAPIETNGATSGQTLISNGTSFIPADTTPASQQLNLIQGLGTRKTNEASGAGTIAPPTQQSFTWVVPPGVDNIFVIMAGAGSSGSGQSNGNVAGSGGAFFQDWLRVVPGQTYNIDIGDGSARSDGANNRHQGGGNTFIQGSATALIDGQASVRIETSGAPGDDSAGTVGNVNFTLGTNTYTVPANLNNIDGGVSIDRFFSSNVLGGFLPAYGKLQGSDWNNVLFRTSGSGTTGGSTAIAAGTDPATAQAGGGAGFLQAEDPAINSGFGRASGPGGIRIGWYSNSEFATAHPLVSV